MLSAHCVSNGNNVSTCEEEKHAHTLCHRKSNPVNCMKEKKEYFFFAMAMDLLNFNPVIEIEWVIGIDDKKMEGERRKEKKTCIS